MIKKISLTNNCEDKLSSFIFCFFDLVNTHKAYYQVSLTFWNQVTIKKPIEEIMKNFFSRFVNIVESIIEEGIKKKYFFCADIKRFSQMLIASIDGVNRHSVFINNKDSSYDEKLEFKIMIFNYLKKSM